MFFITHALGAAFFYLLFFGFDFVSLSFVLIGSLFPDIDYAGSFLGRFFRPIQLMFGHRKFFHSFFGLIFFGSICYLIFGVFSLYFVFGYITHLLLDSLTKGGILWFYPLRFKVKGFCKVGGIFDYFLAFMFVLGIIFIVLGL